MTKYGNRVRSGSARCAFTCALEPCAERREQTTVALAKSQKPPEQKNLSTSFNFCRSLCWPPTAPHFFDSKQKKIHVSYNYVLGKAKAHLAPTAVGKSFWKKMGTAHSEKKKRQKMTICCVMETTVFYPSNRKRGMLRLSNNKQRQMGKTPTEKIKKAGEK